jgi:hypothetical protein
VRNSQKLVALVSFVCKITRQLTFENVYLVLGHHSLTHTNLLLYISCGCIVDNIDHIYVWHIIYIIYVYVCNIYVYVYMLYITCIHIFHIYVYVVYITL